MVEINCAGERLGLLPEKAVFWMASRTLIVTDLHLGKSAAFRKAGIGVPESVTEADLERLRILLEFTGSRRLIILGDLLHSRAGMQPAMLQSMNRWMAQHSSLETILVPGNHDRHCELPPSWNIRCEKNLWHCGPFYFCHEPIAEADSYLMSGHIHPALVLRDKYGPSLRSPCFCFGKNGAILPAFGSFTGMGNIIPKPGDRIFAVGQGKVTRVI
jgi:DNA ligase-associated metallophosphoesterase